MANFFRRIFGGPIRLETDLGGYHAPTSIAYPPTDLLTDGGFGTNRRMRVDVAQTGFFAGREFRTFLELDMANGEVVVIRADVPVDIILFKLETSIVSGELRSETIIGGSEGGTFDQDLPIFPRNTMSERPTPIYEPLVDLTTGGTHTGGTLLDVVLNKTADNANFAGSVGAGTQDERGVGAGLYHFRLTATGAVRGIFRGQWEERTGDN